MSGRSAQYERFIQDTSPSLTMRREYTQDVPKIALMETADVGGGVRISPTPRVDCLFDVVSAVRASHERRQRPLAAGHLDGNPPPPPPRFGGSNSRIRGSIRNACGHGACVENDLREGGFPKLNPTIPNYPLIPRRNEIGTPKLYLPPTRPHLGAIGSDDFSRSLCRLLVLLGVLSSLDVDNLIQTRHRSARGTGQAVALGWYCVGWGK